MFSMRLDVGVQEVLLSTSNKAKLNMNGAALITFVSEF